MNDRPWYHRSIDVEQTCREYPPGIDYVEQVHRMGRDELRALQERRFLDQVRRGWEIPFYRRRWTEAGLGPGDIRTLDDLRHIPAYTVHDLRDSIARDPPFGDYMGLAADEDLPLVMQTSGGTTGLPRPMLYAPKDREVMNILSSRRFWLQGVRARDRVLVTLSLGLANGGMLAREGLWKYSGAIPVMTGTGAVTPTRRQIEMIKAWGVNVLFGFPAYLRHMALVARDELRIDPRSLGVKTILSHLGTDSRERLQDLWGAAVYDCYGTNECGAIAAECEHRSGMHVFEDAFLMEIADPDTLQPKAAGEHGTTVVTTLFRHLAPVIRFNVNDISAFCHGECACGSTMRRMDRIFGRGDNMVKLRGVNLFPEAVGALVGEDPRCGGEYICIAERTADGSRDEMTVLVEAIDAGVDRAGLEAALATRFREALGVKLEVRAVDRGSLDAHTGLTGATKTRRLIDNRGKSPPA